LYRRIKRYSVPTPVATIWDAPSQFTNHYKPLFLTNFDFVILVCVEKLITNPLITNHQSTDPLNLQIKVPIEVVEKQANEYFQETLLHDEQGGNMIDLKVSKTSPIKVVGKDGYLLLTANLHVWAKMKLKKQLLGVFDIYTPQVDKTEFDIEVNYRLKPILSNSWQLLTQTSGTFKWTKKPFMEMVLVKINLAGIISPFVQAQVNTFGQLIDEWVAKELNVHSYVEDAWKIIREPVSLHDDFDLWLDMKLEADKVEVGAFMVATNHIELSLHLPVQPEAIFGTPSISRYQGIRILPDFIINNHLQSQLKRENATAIIGFEALSKLLNHKHFEFDKGKQWVTIEYIRFGTENSTLIAESKINAQVKLGMFTKKIAGTTYIRTTPTYDKASKTLKLNNFSYKLESNDSLLNFGNRLGKRSFQNFLHDKLQEVVNRLLPQLPDFLERQMQHIDVEEYGDLKGTLNYFGMEEIYLTDAAVYISGKVGTEWVLEVKG